MRRPGARWLPAAVLAALACACFGRLVADPSGLVLDGRRPSIDHANRGDPRPVGNDAVFVFLPRHVQVAASLRAFGHLPGWDASGFGGRPLVGNPQAGLFYPPAWISWWSGSPAVLGWLSVAHLLWGGLGCYVLARQQGLERWPATLAAGVFQASPYLLAHVFEGHAPHVWSACWFPWAFWAYLEHRAGHARGFLALPPILASGVLAGHPQEWLLLVVTLSILAVGDSLSILLRGTFRGAARCLGGWLAALGLCLGLAAVDLVPVLESLSWTAVGGQGEAGLALPRNYFLQVWNALQLLSPWALGGPADFAGPSNYWETLVSFGLVSTLLMGIGLGAALRGRDGEGGSPVAAGWLVLAVLTLWFAAGPSLGLFTAFHRLVPGMARFRVPARSLFLTAVAAAMLAGFGLQALIARGNSLVAWRRFAARLAAIGVLLAAFLAVAILTLPPATSGGDDHLQTSVRNACRLGEAAGRILTDPVLGASLAALAGVVALGCLTAGRTRRPWAAHLVGALALAELAAQGYALLQVAPASEFFGPDPISAAIFGLPSPDPSGAPPRLRARDSFYLDLQAIRHGLEKTNVNDVFQLGHAAALYEQLYAVASHRNPRTMLSTLVTEPAEQRRIRQAVFDRMAVSYLVSDRIEEDPGWPLAATGRDQAGREFVIQRNPTALPHAYVVPGAEVVADEATTILRRFPDSDPRRAVMMAFDPLSSIATAPRQPFTPARWLGKDPDHLRLEVTTSAPGLLVIADTWMPGWTARLDGRRVPILRGNFAQRVIALPEPGPHRIELDYRPPGLALGVTLSGLSTAILAVLAVVIFRVARRRPARPASPTRTPGPHLAHREALSVEP